MKQILITALRDTKASIEHYRQSADQLATLLAIESSRCIPKVPISVNTPLATTRGVELTPHIVLVPILRSGLVLLYPFMHFYPQARVGFVGIRRNEETAVPKAYYSKLPSFTENDTLLLLDPMVATGGSASLAIEMLRENGAQESQITLIAFIGAPEGIGHLKKYHSEVGLIIAQIDEGLDTQKRIVPGLGDFGDRYFGTEQE